MQDPRIDKLANVLIHHSCRLQPGQKLLIEAFDLPEPNLICRLAVTNLKCNLDWRNSRVRLRWVSYIRGIVVVDC